MPCTYTGSLEGDRALSAEENAKELKEELDRATDLLCYVMGNYELEDPPLDLLEWWEEHKKRDRKRRKSRR